MTGAPAEPVPGSSRRGLIIVAVATAVAGLGGYLVTTLAARGLGADLYSFFAVFWGALYLVIGALSGFQQEFSRAVHPTDRESSPDERLLARFTVAAVGCVAVLLAVLLLAGTSAAFPEYGWELSGPLMAGAVVYVAVAVTTGVLYGTRAWSALAVVIVGDVALRALAFAVVLLVAGRDVVALAWASVIPFPLILLVLTVALRRPTSRAFHLDAGGRVLAVNSLRTVIAGIGASLLVSGFPLLIGLAGGAGAEVGVLVYVLVLARAPLVVTTMALQSYLVVVFRRRPDRTRVVLLACAAVAALGLVVAVAAWFGGPWLVELLGGPDYRVAPVVPAALVLASTTTGWLAITGAGVLSAGDHRGYVWGWTIAAAISVVMLFALPGELFLRVALALAVGPLVGAGLQLVRIVRVRPQHPAAEHDA